MRESVPDEGFLVAIQDPVLQAELGAALVRAGHLRWTAASRAEGLEVLARERVAAILTEAPGPGTLGRAAFARWVQAYRGIPVVAVSRSSSIELAVACIRMGAADFVVLPHGEARLEAVLRAAVDAARAVGSGSRVGADHAPSADDIRPLADEERRIVLRALELTGWNVQEAARRLRVGRATLYRRIQAYGLTRPPGSARTRGGGPPA